MRLNYKFSNLCGVAYKGGNVVYTKDGTGLFSAVGRRVTFFDLLSNTGMTFSFEMPLDISHLALNPSGTLLLVIDAVGHSLLLSILKGVVLHEMDFHEPVTAISFNHSGTMVAIACGSKFRIWRTPSPDHKEFSPFTLIRTCAGHTMDVISFDWSKNEKFILTASTDMTSRIYSVSESFESTTEFEAVELLGHRHPLQGAYFFSNEDKDECDRIATIGRNGTIILWRVINNKSIVRTGHCQLDKISDDDEGDQKVWITCLSHSSQCNFLVAGFSNGLVGIYSLPLTDDSNKVETIYSLGITQSSLSTIAINSSGEWLALGVSELGQLVVWEWRSESFILRQQGHADSMRSLAYSPDAQYMATGSDDGKVKLWDSHSGLCVSVFNEHKAPVTAIEFSKNGKVIVSASNDGTVRAFDLIRFRNFRTFTTPTPVQFYSLALDPSGEIIAAGTLDTFEIFLWSMKTGQLLEILPGHTGPVSALSFDPVGHVLASGSWDKSVKLWEVYSRNKNTQTLSHSADVLAIAFRPDGQEISSVTIKGEVTFWNVELAAIQSTMETRRDYADKPLSTSTIKSLCYSPDGSLLLAGGSFPFVALYDISTRILLRRYPVTTLRKWSSTKVVNSSDDNDTTNSTASNVSCVRFAPTGRAFSALTGEGLVVFSLDESLTFDPFDLQIDLTPDRIRSVLLEERHYLKAFVMSLKLNISVLSEQVWEAIPSDNIVLVCREIPTKYLLPALSLLASLSSKSHRLQLLLKWISALLNEHALRIRLNRGRYAPVLRILSRNIRHLYTDLGKVSNETLYMLQYYNETIAQQ